MSLLFRCFRCQQVLKTSRSKVGSIVHCVKCGTELIVPEPPPPQDQGPGPRPGSDEATRELVPGPTSERTQRMAPPLVSDLDDIRPEDIRAHFAADPPTRTGPAPSRTEFERLIHPDAPPSRPEPEPRSVPLEPPPTLEVAEPELALPPIVLQPEPIRPEPGVNTAEQLSRTRRRDVSLPRSTVVAWSWLVLLAVAFAFLAGVLAGHFLWVERMTRS